MDNFERDRKQQKASKAYPNCHAFLSHRALSLSYGFGLAMLLAFSLAGCGGGGGGGTASSGKVAVSSPIFARQSERQALSFGPHFETEYNRQTGLDDIGVAAAFDAGYAGFNVRAGVVDTGVYKAHSQLSHIAAGQDFHDASQGLIDPDGHGTHVASLMAARREGVGMHGVAPHAHVKSYRIFNHNGSFAGKSGSQIVPSLVSHAVQNDIMLLNNSWASNYEVTDLSKVTTKSVLGAELTAWQKAVQKGLVMVWAAGNQGDDQVSVRAGLPYHYSDVKKGWLAVVSFDPNGKEPRYTNRCGVARDWCLAAPGGGDSVSTLGIYGARSGGGYERRSGTSMAAPHVSGALAIVLDAFPQLTPQQGAVRLLETAHYEGLTTADGCTIETCTASQMADVFGQGRVSLEDALAPIGSLSLAASAAPASLQDASLDTGLIIDEALFSAMTGVRFKAYDSFDGSAFAVSATSLISSPDSRFHNSAPKAVTHIAHKEEGATKGQFVSYIGGSGAFPDALSQRGQLHDVSQRAMQSWTGLGRVDALGDWQAHFGYEPSRQVMMMRRTLSTLASETWLGLGFDKADNLFLDSRGTGSLAWGKTHALWLNAGHYLPMGDGGLTAEYQMGQSQAGGGDNCLICEAKASFNSWSLGYEAPLAHHDADISLALHQPLHLTRVEFQLIGANRTKLKAAPQRPPVELATGLHYRAAAGALHFTHRMKQSDGAERFARGVAHDISASWHLPF